MKRAGGRGWPLTELLTALINGGALEHGGAIHYSLGLELTEAVEGDRAALLHRGSIPGWAGDRESRIPSRFCSSHMSERRTADYAIHPCGASAVARRRSRPANGCESRCECEPVGVCTHLDLLSPCLIII